MPTFPTTFTVPVTNQTSFARSIIRTNALILDALAVTDSARVKKLDAARQALAKATADASTTAETAMVSALLDYMLYLVSMPAAF